MKKINYFIVKRNPNGDAEHRYIFEPVTGWMNSYTLPNGEELQIAVRKYRSQWTVDEVSTGMGIINGGKTRQEAFQGITEDLLQSIYKALQDPTNQTIKKELEAYKKDCFQLAQQETA